MGTISNISFVQASNILGHSKAFLSYTNLCGHMKIMQIYV